MAVVVVGALAGLTVEEDEGRRLTRIAPPIS
jgi:hypothetical protein